MMQRSNAIHRVAAVEIGGRGGTEGRQRPAVVGDLLGLPVPVGFTADDERRLSCQPGVGPVPAWQSDGLRVDLLEIDDVRPGLDIETAEVSPPRTRTCIPVARAASRFSGSVTMRSTPSIRIAVWISRPGGRRTATAPSRDSAAMTASALGRVSMTTPTCAAGRTPADINPRTTLSIRWFTAS